jgi:hypothetical protein
MAAAKTIRHDAKERRPMSYARGRRRKHQEEDDAKIAERRASLHGT